MVDLFVSDELKQTVVTSVCLWNKYIEPKKSTNLYFVNIFFCQRRMFSVFNISGPWIQSACMPGYKKSWELKPKTSGDETPSGSHSWIQVSPFCDHIFWDCPKFQVGPNFQCWGMLQLISVDHRIHLQPFAVSSPDGSTFQVRRTRSPVGYFIKAPPIPLYLMMHLRITLQIPLTKRENKFTVNCGQSQTFRSFSWRNCWFSTFRLGYWRVSVGLRVASGQHETRWTWLSSWGGAESSCQGSSKWNGSVRNWVLSRILESMLCKPCFKHRRWSAVWVPFAKGARNIRMSGLNEWYHLISLLIQFSLWKGVRAIPP